MSRPEIPYLQPGETLMSRPDIANQVIAEFNRWQKCEGMGNIEVEHSESGIKIRRTGAACTVTTRFEDDFEEENGGVPVTPWGTWDNWHHVTGYTPDAAAICTNLAAGDPSGVCAGIGRAEDDFNIVNHLVTKSTAWTDVKRGRYTLSFRYAPGPDILEQVGLGYADMSVSDYRVTGGTFFTGQTDGSFPIADAVPFAFQIYPGDAWTTYTADFEVAADLPYLSFGFAVANALPVALPNYPHYTLVLIDDVQIVNRCPFN